jgi:hypothetical protein
MGPDGIRDQDWAEIYPTDRSVFKGLNTILNQFIRL